MSCAIHLCVEKHRVKTGWYRDYQLNTDSKERVIKVFKHDVYPSGAWSSCLITCENPWGDQHYDMFAKLANVRNDNNLEHLPIRGFPKDACFFTLCEYSRRVAPDSDYDEDDCHIISESKAEEWIKKGYSKEITVQNVPRSWQDCRFVTDPDYHSPNWCTLKELEDAVKEIFYEKEIEDYVQYAEEWLALIGYMKGLESAGFETRCVFWFDN